MSYMGKTPGKYKQFNDFENNKFEKQHDTWVGNVAERNQHIRWWQP